VLRNGKTITYKFSFFWDLFTHPPNILFDFKYIELKYCHLVTGFLNSYDEILIPKIFSIKVSRYLTCDCDTLLSAPGTHIYSFFEVEFTKVTPTASFSSIMKCGRLVKTPDTPKTKIQSANIRGMFLLQKRIRILILDALTVTCKCYLL
jgi:hypothetical protein